MENLLLVWDELDDVVSTVRAIWPSIASFLLAVFAFIATGLLSLYAPMLVIGASVLLLVVGYVVGLKDRDPQQAAIEI
jgi:ABC-type transport system involved in cytochrome bd biosynthesis fused ATPase/permease subunit